MLYLLFSFRGRINRKQYWFGTTLVSVANVITQIIIQAAAGSGAGVTLAERANAFAHGSAVALPLSIAALWAGLAIQYKRFHDRGRPGWLSFAPMVAMLMLIANVVGDAFAQQPLLTLVNNALPYVAVLLLIGLAMFVDLGCLPSQEGANKYGDPPGSPGGVPYQPPPSGPKANAFANAESAIDRAIAQREAAPVAKPSAPSRPAVNLAPQLAPAPTGAGPRGFGRRPTR